MESVTSGRNRLYRLGAFAALFAALITRRNCSAEMAVSGGFGIWEVPAQWPVSAADWFAILQQNRFVGLVLLDAIDLVNAVLIAMLFLAIYAALRHTAKSAALIATIMALVGFTISITSNQALALLNLSDQHTKATGAQRLILEAAGEALLAQHYHSTATYLGLLFVLLAGLLYAWIMLQSTDFSRAAGGIGLIANGVALLYFPVLVLAPTFNWLPPTLSAPFRIAWYVLVSLQLLKLDRIETDPERASQYGM